MQIAFLTPPLLADAPKNMLWIHGTIIDSGPGMQYIRGQMALDFPNKADFKTAFTTLISAAALCNDRVISGFMVHLAYSR